MFLEMNFPSGPLVIELCDTLTQRPAEGCCPMLSMCDPATCPVLCSLAHHRGPPVILTSDLTARYHSRMDDERLLRTVECWNCGATVQLGMYVNYWTCECGSGGKRQSPEEAAAIKERPKGTMERRIAGGAQWCPFIDFGDGKYHMSSPS